eukprot:m.38184 g.38184  ORF g.38184 m.38184 type:complete len:307 (-) comp7782_c0_seq1:117-1037(-)
MSIAGATMNYAKQGCSDLDRLWSIWLSVIVSIHFFFGLVHLIGPFDVFPYLGKGKYLNLHPFSGVKDVSEADWDPITVATTHGFAVNLITGGLIALWAMDDVGFSFAAMVVTSEVLGILSWVYVYFRFRENWKWTIFVPANLHLLTLIVALVLLIDYDKDETQLKPGGGEVDAGALLWVMFATRAVLCALWYYAVAVPQLFLSKASHIASRFAFYMGVNRATSSMHIFFVLLWAVLSYENKIYDYEFPLAYWCGLMTVYLTWIPVACSQEDMWHPHFYVAWCSMYMAMGSVTIALWYASCYAALPL